MLYDIMKMSTLLSYLTWGFKDKDKATTSPSADHGMVLGVLLM